MIAIITGTFGVGKTTLIRHISENYNTDNIIETYDEEILGNYYEAFGNFVKNKTKESTALMHHAALTSQMYFIAKRLDSFNDALFKKKKDICILDGSIVSDEIIAKSLNKNKILDDASYAVYKYYVIGLKEFINKTLGTKKIKIICLHPPSCEFALSNIKKREHKIETSITLEYIQQIEEGFKSMECDKHFYLTEKDYDFSYSTKTFNDIIKFIIE